MSKIKASENKAAAVETKPIDEVKNVEAKQPASEVADVKTEMSAPVAKAVEAANQANSEFDKKLSGEAVAAGKTDYSDDKIPEESDKAADDKDSGDKAVKDTEQQDESDIVSDELAKRAEDAGLTQEQIEGFITVEALEHTVGILEARQKTVTPAPKTEEKPPEKPEDEKPFDCGLDPDAYDEGLIKAVNKLGSDLTAKIKSQEKIIERLLGHQQEQEQSENTSWFDGRISELGEDFEDVLGKGTIKDIDKASQQFKNRAALDMKMNVLAQSYKLAGQEIPKKDELFNEALLILHKEKIRQKDLKPTTNKLKLRASQTIGRGSNKSTAATLIDIANQANRDFDRKFSATG